MTQDASALAPTPAAETTPAAPAPTVPQYKTLEDIFAEIRKRSGLESLQDVTQTARVVWLDPDGKRMVINLTAQLANGQRGPAPNPFEPKEKSVIVGLFYDEDDFRVYALPNDGTGFPQRYLLSKKGVTFAVDQMLSIEQFIDAMAEEYEARGIAEGVIEDEDDDLPEGEPS